MLENSNSQLSNQLKQQTTKTIIKYIEPKNNIRVENQNQKENQEIIRLEKDIKILIDKYDMCEARFEAN